MKAPHQSTGWIGLGRTQSSPARSSATARRSSRRCRSAGGRWSSTWDPGTGLCCGLLREKVGPRGGVVGIEESPQMAAVARERIAAEGWRNVSVVESPAEDAEIAVAALFCAVHDILQSPDALRNVLSRLRP